MIDMFEHRLILDIGRKKAIFVRWPDGTWAVSINGAPQIRCSKSDWDTLNQSLENAAIRKANNLRLP